MKILHFQFKLSILYRNVKNHSIIAIHYINGRIQFGEEHRDLAENRICSLEHIFLLDMIIFMHPTNPYSLSRVTKERNQTFCVYNLIHRELGV